jgi:hypothetical protein
MRLRFRSRCYLEAGHENRSREAPGTRHEDRSRVHRLVRCSRCGPVFRHSMPATFPSDAAAGRRCGRSFGADSSTTCTDDRRNARGVSVRPRLRRDAARRLRRALQLRTRDVPIERRPKVQALRHGVPGTGEDDDGRERVRCGLFGAGGSVSRPLLRVAVS